MRDCDKAFDRLTADALGGTIWSDELWILGLEFFQLVVELVELLVGDLGFCFDVIEEVVMVNEPAQLLGSFFVFGGGHVEPYGSSRTFFRQSSIWRIVLADRTPSICWTSVWSRVRRSLQEA